MVGGPVPPGSDAITIGSVISVREGHEQSPYLMRHEAVHVRQWHRADLPRRVLEQLELFLVQCENDELALLGCLRQQRHQVIVLTDYDFLGEITQLGG